MANLSHPMFHNDDAARAHLEAIRWPHGPNCPHCGNADQETIAKVEGRKKSHRDGLYYCNACKGTFTVTVGTVMERSKVALHKWVLAFHLYAASKKGMSAHQLHRMIGVTYKTAWFMSHRIREAMMEDVDSSGPIGGETDIVEADETYIGKAEDQKAPVSRQGRPYKSKKFGTRKQTIFSLVKRGGSVRSFVVKGATTKQIQDILFRNVPRDTALYTDESRIYHDMRWHYAEHQTVKHSAGEYVRGNVHTNTIENVFSVFKRGMRGVYQHCAEKHLHRYLAEFDFRYNRRSALEISDSQRANDAIRGAIGKRLMYQQTGTA